MTAPQNRALYNFVFVCNQSNNQLRNQISTLRPNFTTEFAESANFVNEKQCPLKDCQDTMLRYRTYDGQKIERTAENHLGQGKDF